MNIIDCINSQCGATAGDCGCAAKVREVAAVLDGLAKRMWVRGEQKSAEECRALAERLRK